MSKFDPSRAVLVDEDGENVELEDFLSAIDKKAKTFRAQVIGDAFRDLATTAKTERTKLLDAAATKFADAAARDRNTLVEVFNKRVLAAQGRFTARLEKLLESQQALEKAVKSGEGKNTDAGAGAAKAVAESVADAMKSIREELKDMAKKQKEEHAELVASLGAIEDAAQQERAKEKATKWKFTADRDAYGRIDLDRGVVATQIK